MEGNNFDDKPRTSKIIVGQMAGAPARQNERSPAKGTSLLVHHEIKEMLLEEAICMMAPTNERLQQLAGSVVQQ